MSTDPSPRSLDQWIATLVRTLDEEPGSAIRLRRIADGRRARIVLDGEAVVVQFDSTGALLASHEATGATVDGQGATTSGVVAAIIEGRLDATDAVASGLVDVRGRAEAVTAMLHMIELLLDASARLPGLRTLADDFVARHDRQPDRTDAGAPGRPSAGETDLLGRLDLLPE